MRGEDFKALESYKRFAYTDSGISPLGVPGEAPHVVVVDSDEHSEEGHIIEDGPTRAKMVEKRLLRKLPRIAEEISPPMLYGDPEPDTVIVGWGSTYGCMKEAVDVLSPAVKIAMMHFSEIYPFPSTAKFDYLDPLKGARQTVCIENNALGKFASLMRAETGFVFHDRINRFDGRPFTLETLVEEIKAVVEKRKAADGAR